MPPLALEDFETPGPGRGAAPEDKVPASMLETERAAGYESGYQAGWDDAARAHADDQQRIGAEFARTLQELSFTFHEARAHVIGSMEPLLDQLVGTLLPAMVAETLGARILEELRPLIEDAADTPVELVVAPASRPAIERHMSEVQTAAIRLTEEPSMAPEQAYLRLGKTEHQIDLTDALDRIAEAVRALYTINERTLKHG